MVSTLAAQSADETTAKVIKLNGSARYKMGNSDWQQLKLGDTVRQGTLIETAGKSRVDLLLGTATPPVNRPVPSEMVTYQPTAEQNVVRMWENTLMSIDTLTEKHTGADVVTDTKLDLKAGHILGSVRKMSAASKYEVKIPVGVAAVRGTIFDISAEGVIKVLVGSVVLAYVGPNGNPLTQLIMGLQMFDARTGTLSALPESDRTGMGLPVMYRSGVIAVTPPPPPFISPH